MNKGRGRGRGGGGGGGFGGGGGGGKGERPGDWKCPDCGFRNFASRYKCKDCDASKPAVASGSKSASGSGVGVGRGSAGGGSGEVGRGSSIDTEWKCPKCGFSNFGSKSECMICEPRKPAAGGGSASASSGGGGVGGFHGEKGRGGGGKGSRAGDWNCTCGASNYASGSQCYKCKAKKEGAGKSSSGGDGAGAALMQMLLGAAGESELLVSGGVVGATGENKPLGRAVQVGAHGVDEALVSGELVGAPTAGQPVAGGGGAGRGAALMQKVLGAVGRSEPLASVAREEAPGVDVPRISGELVGASGGSKSVVKKVFVGAPGVSEPVASGAPSRNQPLQSTGAGRGGPRQMSITTSFDILPHAVTLTTIKKGPMGWRDENVAPDQLQLPKSLGAGDVAEENIGLIVNHVKSSVKLPKEVYQYEIDIDLSEECKVAKKARRARKGAGGGPSGAAAAQPTAKDPPRPKLWKKIAQKVKTLLETWHYEDTSSPIVIATDGYKIMYTVSELSKTDNATGSYSFQFSLTTLEDDGETGVDTYTVTVTRVAIIPTENFQEYMSDIRQYVEGHSGEQPGEAPRLSQIYNIVLKTTPLYRFTPVGRASFFPDPPRGGDGYRLGGGLVNWSGFSLIFNFGWQPFINIDIANSAFLLGKSVYDVLDELRVNPRDVRSWRDDQFKKANNLLRSCKVSYEWRGGREKYTKRVSEVSRQHAAQHVFTSGSGSTNVLRYCAEEKGYKLKNPYGICLKLGNAIVPAEVCTVVKGQVFSQKLQDAQTAAMIKNTAKKPEERLGSIRSALTTNACGADVVLQEFGVSVEDELLTLDNARVLPAPTLVYGSSRANEQKHVEPGRDGVWNMKDSSLRFVCPYVGKVRWGIIEIAKEGRGLRDDSFRRFIVEFLRVGHSTGLDLGSVEDVFATLKTNPIPPGPKMFKNLCEDLQWFRDKGYKLVVVITPEKNTQMYSQVKQAAELFVKGGVLTQVVVSDNVYACKRSTLENIILKVNSKLGGINYLMLANQLYEKIDILCTPVIIIGADVTHPPMGSNIPSLAAVTASLDRTGMPYLMHSQAQRKASAGAAEIIERLDLIMIKLLTRFIVVTEHKPRKIIFYRDGVGETQFAEVLQKEMMQIRAACEVIGADPSIMAQAKKDIKLNEPKCAYQPQITFLAVQKRHKTRFFPANPADGVGKPQNAPPGTVVDTQIVNANNIDCYLLSHTGIQGTSRPTRYQVLWDDSSFSINELQLLTYFLCFMYCRCTRSVSYPAPTYYAHLAATRAKMHLPFGLTDAQYEDIPSINAAIKRQGPMIEEFPMHFV